LIEIKPKLLAGSDDEIRIIGHNTSGFPSTKDNTHKLKNIETLFKDIDGAVILETGVNKN